MSEERKAVFDAALPIRIRLSAGAEKKEVVVRFPTDEEWVEWRLRRKVIIKQLGRGQSETTTPNSEEADADLVEKLRSRETELVGQSQTVAGPELDKYEAAMVVDQLQRAEVDDVFEFPGGLHVALRVPGGTVHHDIQMLSAKDLLQYRRAFARVLDLPYNKPQLTINLPAAGELYDRLGGKSDDYAGAVPISHKASIVRAAVDAIESGLGVADSENP